MAENQGVSAKLRDHYLQTLGIVQYVPKDHVQDIEIENRVEQTLATESSAQMLDSKASQQSAIETLLQTEAEEKPNKNPVKVAVSSTIVQEDTPTLALQFALWQPADELLIVTSVEGQLPNSQQVNLLARIVAAIDHQSSGLPQFEVINWPPHASVQGDEHEVREFLSTLIKARLAAKPTKLLLIMGELAENWLLSPEKKNTVKNGSFQMTPDVIGLVTPSLIEMLNQPQSKQLTWQMISQYLKQHGV